MDNMESDVDNSSNKQQAVRKTNEDNSSPLVTKNFLVVSFFGLLGGDKTQPKSRSVTSGPVVPAKALTCQTASFEPGDR